MIRADLYYAYIRHFRVVFAGGRYGSGKTLLSVATGLYFLRRGLVNSIVCNFPVFPLDGLVVDDPFQAKFQDIADRRSTFFIYDESWRDLGKGAGFSRVVEYLAYLRKRESFLFLASVLPLAREVSFYRVYRLRNWMALGIPLWEFRLELASSGFKEKDKFYMPYPQQYFKYYDHAYVPGDMWWSARRG